MASDILGEPIVDGILVVQIVDEPVARIAPVCDRPQRLEIRILICQLNAHKMCSSQGVESGTYISKPKPLEEAVVLSVIHLLENIRSPDDLPEDRNSGQCCP